MLPTAGLPYYLVHFRGKARSSLHLFHKHNNRYASPIPRKFPLLPTHLDLRALPAGVLDVPMPVEAVSYLRTACAAAGPGPVGVPRSTVAAWQRARTCPAGPVVTAFCTGPTIRAGVVAVLSSLSATALLGSVAGFSP